MNFLKPFLSLTVFSLFLFSCGETKEQSKIDSLASKITDSVKNGIPPAPSTSSQNIEARTFEVIDSLGKHQGWGYDLYVDGKRSIHQPIIPAVPGNDAFKTEADAKKIGDLAVAKMKITGSLPTVSIHDLDSLGVKHK